MAYLKFNKAELVNLEYSLKREMIATNRTGAYCNTTIVCCNTRKYHCLLAVPIEKMNWRRHALLSGLDETLIQHGKSFNLGIHCYGEVFEPRGHKYIVDYQNSPVPTITYNVGGMQLQKQILMVQNQDRVLIKYTLLDAHSDTTIRLKPFLSFRSIHELTKCNPNADTHYHDIENGKAFKLYNDLPYLNMQISKEAEWVANPDWYYGVAYPEEKRRGCDYNEDLFVPGFFEMPIKKGESIVFSASTTACISASIKRTFTTEYEKIEDCDDFDSTLRHAASRLFFERAGRLEICSGFPWFGVGQLRDTGICVSGLTLHNNGDRKAFLRVVDGIIDKWKEDLLITTNMVEAPLRLASIMQNYIGVTGDDQSVWKRYSKILKEIIKSYIAGRPEAQAHENGMIWAQKRGVALTWMDTYTNGHPVVERAGYQVETNALWYNALRFYAAMSHKYEKSQIFADELSAIADKIEQNFMEMFWVKERNHLADFVGTNGKNIFNRPNQLYVCALDYSPVSEEVQNDILKAVKRELLTTRGIRTLAPDNPFYKETYDGDLCARELASHNGSTRPWLLGMYVQGNLKLHGKSFIREAENLIKGFEEDITIHGIGAVAELYDGNPPFYPHGAINSALSTSEILTIKYLINQYQCKETKK